LTAKASIVEIFNKRLIFHYSVVLVIRGFIVDRLTAIVRLASQLAILQRACAHVAIRLMGGVRCIPGL
jgi:hypothetical protein